MLKWKWFHGGFYLIFLKYLEMIKNEKFIDPIFLRYHILFRWAGCWIDRRLPTWTTAWRIAAWGRTWNTTRISRRKWWRFWWRQRRWSSWIHACWIDRRLPGSQYKNVKCCSKGVTANSSSMLLLLSIWLLVLFESVSNWIVENLAVPVKILEDWIWQYNF